MRYTKNGEAMTPWSGEFTNRRQEAAFRRSVRDTTAGLLRAAMLTAALLFLVLGVADFPRLGPTDSFFQLLGLRLLAAAGCLLTWWAVRRNPDLTFRFAPLNPVIWLGCTVLILIVPLGPDTLSTHAPSAAVAVMALYLFVPNRVPWMVAASLYLTLGFLATTALWVSTPPSVVLVQSLVLGFANVVGFLSARRLARLQRRQYASLLDERAYCRRLQGEIRERARLEQRLRHMAGTDELTGLDNRRRFFERAEHALHRTQRHGSPMTLCMIDLDHFKTINDRYGHAVGDRVLVQVAGQCRRHIRDIDIIGRIGGEEFVIAFPDTDLGKALDINERLRRCIEATPTLELDVHEPLSVTIGIACIEPGETTLTPALHRADAALYRGKALGRNRVMVHGVEDEPRLVVVDG
ncbi:GGDEF domain-containing protein [Halomonas organivorans]|uniref:diguanylate cyclase n=1 Tax=Halomonas organivorans TaxID=257772 RepID=A0A7W5BWI8_9GAMM|nr:GGDEF domain-containing protein [Halomonas organivorans]MBB3139973.1 diguanylate cyclase (GGDEF)-like protein [Halomonas organivorans]